MTFWYPDPKPLTYGSGILLFSLMADKMPTKKVFTVKVFAYYFFKVHLHQFHRLKVKKKSQIEIVEIQVFSSFFCLILTGSDPGSGSVIFLRIREAFFTIRRSLCNVKWLPSKGQIMACSMLILGFFIRSQTAQANKKKKDCT
jgi:hypothetical protein